jgi:hypothetical protein
VLAATVGLLAFVFRPVPPVATQTNTVTSPFPIPDSAVEATRDAGSGSRPGWIAESAQDFRSTWNAAAEAAHVTNFVAEAPFSIDASGQEQDRLTHSLSQQVTLEANVNKADGTVREAWITAEPGPVTEATLLLAAWRVLVDATNAQTQPEDRENVLARLGLAGVQIGDLSSHKAETTLGRIQYWTFTSALTGPMFGARDAKDPRAHEGVWSDS